MRYYVNLGKKVSPIKKIKPPAMVVVQPDNYKDNQIKYLKKQGYKVLAYLSIGTISNEREWYKKYEKYKLRKLPDWPHEYYMNMRAAAWTNFLINRAKFLLRNRPFDGLWLDNLDVYEEYKSAAMYEACANLLKKIKKMGKYVMVNGGSEFWDVSIDKKRKLTDMVSGITQEEVFSFIKNYSGKGKFGKQASAQSKFYQTLIKKILRRKVEVYLLEYTINPLISKQIKNFCKKEKVTGYYISKNVDL